MKKIFVILLLMLAFKNVSAQNNSGYDKPFQNKPFKNGDLIDYTDYTNQWPIENQMLTALRSTPGNFKFSIEYLCVDKNEKSIIRKLYEFPLPKSNKVKTESGTKDLETDIYFYSFYLPLEVFDPEILKKFEKSDLKMNNFRRIQISILPDRHNNFGVIIKNEVTGIPKMWEEHYSTADFLKNRKFKIKINPSSYFLLKEAAFTVDLEKSFSRYVNEYIIISLEE